MRKEIEKMINDEYGNAIENYGKFHSLHKAESVLREEIEEAQDEVWEIRKHYECLWKKLNATKICPHLIILKTLLKAQQWQLRS